MSTRTRPAGSLRHVLLATTLLLLLALTTAASPASSQAEEGVQVIWGPTPIAEGEALSSGDLTLMNEYLAATFGIGTLPPWGVTRGNIIDLAPVVDGQVGADIIAQFSLPVNGWGNWAEFDVENIQVIDNTPQNATVVLTGYWKDIRVEMRFTLESGKPYLHVVTTLTNEGEQAYTDLVSGYAISFKKGWTFTPGFGTGRHYAPTPKEELGAVEDWVSGYYEDFAAGIYAPYYTHLSTSTGWVDPFTIHTLQPGETRVFEGYLIVLPKGDTCAIRQVIAEIKGEQLATISGTVASGEEPVPNPIVTAFLPDGRPYCWTIGNEDGSYTMALPEGEYQLQATGRGYGLSQKASVTASLVQAQQVDFTDVGKPGTVRVTVYDAATGEPLDAKILISGGETPIVRFLSITTVYTSPDVDKMGLAEFNLPPGNYTITVDHAAGFLAEPLVFEGVEVQPEATVELEAPIEILVDPNEYGWYSADLHHHSNYLDGRTPPEYVIVAQSAAGLDFAFISDHDWVENHEALAQLAAERGMPFIPSVEVSPAWAHFNPYPLPLGVYDTIRGTPCEMMEVMRSLGAIVIRVNHPYTGYFSSWEANDLPGAYCEDWDVAEINGRWGRTDNMTVMKMWELWNANVRKYLTAGSDVHDVWATPYTGYPRVYAFLGTSNPSEVTPVDFATAEKAGLSYVTYGPLLLMTPLPGTSVSEPVFDLNLSIFAVDGVQRVVLVSEGQSIYDEAFDGQDQIVDLTITVDVTENILDDARSWVQVLVWDNDGDLALSNPIWVDLLTIPPPPETQTVTQTKTQTVTETLMQTTTLTETTTQTTTATTTVTETTTVEKTVTQTTTETYTMTKEATPSTTTVTQTETVTQTVSKTGTAAALAGIALVIGIVIGVLSRRT